MSGPKFVRGDAALGTRLTRHQATASATSTLEVVGRRKPIDVSWLRLAAATYRLSSDLRDYVLFSVPAVTSDLPNRNAQAFTYEELVFFSPIYGRPTYRTFVGKPVHVEHKNEDPTQAKGVIFDASLVPVKKYGVYKVLLLVGVDRTKDPELARDVVRGETAWSMGALVDVFQCSVCGANVTRYPCTCFSTVGKGGLLQNRVVYELCVGVNYIEVSLVSDPADVTAWGSLLD